MEDIQSNEWNKAMDIYVEDGKLKCAPFGYSNDEKYILEYDIEDDVLLTEEWQHISCIFINDIVVKGQYMKTNLNIDPIKF